MAPLLPHGYAYGCSSPAPSHYGCAKSVQGAPNGCGGGDKSQQCPKYFLQYRTYATERLQFRIWGRQTCFLPWAPSNLVTPLRGTCNNKLMKVNLSIHEVCTTPSINKKRNHLIYCDCSRWISSVSCEKCDFKGGFTQNPVYVSDRQRLTVRFGNRLACSGMLSHRSRASFRERLTICSRNTSSSC